MKKFFAKDLKNETFSFYDDDSNHLLNVLRIKENDQIICIFENKMFLSEIVSLQPLRSKLINEIQNDIEFKDVNISLFQSIIKPKHMEWILSKCTELHLNNFYPILLQRCQKNNLIKKNRMENIVISASKQSGRLNLPIVHYCIDLDWLINNINNFDLIIVPYETKENINIGKQIDQINFSKNFKIGFLVGPEGGFSQLEILKLKQIDKIKLVSLSKTILRSETASFYCLSILIDNLINKGIN